MSFRAVGETLKASEDRDVRIDALRVLAQRAQPASAPHLRETLKKEEDAALRDIIAFILAEFDRAEARQERQVYGR